MNRTFKRTLVKWLRRVMPTAAGCSNCRTKYTLLTRENGCSNCALSFCQKCVSYRAHIPHLADKPVSVCYECYKKIEANKIKQTANNAQISYTPLYPSVSTPSSSSNSSFSNSNQPVCSNWWGEGLPPPSMRHQYGMNGPQPPARPRAVAQRVREHAKEGERREKENAGVEMDPETKDLEKRIGALKQDHDDSSQSVPSIDEIESRLAALRGCDVELIRNPRSWFSSSSNPPSALHSRPADTVSGLMEQAAEEAALAEKYDPDRLIGEQIRRIKDEQPVDKRDEGGRNVEEEGENRISMAPSEMSVDTAFSEATEEEMKEIKRMLSDAQNRVDSTEADEKKMDSEMREVMKATRQKSEDIQKVNQEFSSFWDRQMNKTLDASSSDDEPLDDVAIRRIVAEAEASPDFPSNDTTSNTQPSGEGSAPSPGGSPKKKNFFTKLFKR